MKVAYVAGRYRAENAYGIGENILRARAVAADLWAMGYCALTPHMNSAFFDGVADDSVFLEGGIELLKRSDLVVLVPGWESSSGTLAECEVARENGIDIYDYGINEHRKMLEERAGDAVWQAVQDERSG